MKIRWDEPRALDNEAPGPARRKPRGVYVDRGAVCWGEVPEIEGLSPESVQYWPHGEHS